MREAVRVITEKVDAFRQDYIKAKARISVLKASPTQDTEAELSYLENYVQCIDDMVEAFPETQREVVKLSILGDLPLTKVALEIGYHYTWALELRHRAVQTIEEVLDPEKVISSSLGKQIEQVLKEHAQK
nr:MAG TPA: Protein of unknown function (DUF722) [Caudoviricetes sp.]